MRWCGGAAARSTNKLTAAGEQGRAVFVHHPRSFISLALGLPLLRRQLVFGAALERRHGSDGMRRVGRRRARARARRRRGILSYHPQDQAFELYPMRSIDEKGVQFLSILDAIHPIRNSAERNQGGRGHSGKSLKRLTAARGSTVLDVIKYALSNAHQAARQPI